VAILETQVDDMTSQAIAYVMEELLKNGALDVFSQAIGMKKSRPGILLTVICHSDRLTACESILIQETSTLGIRKRWQERLILPRQIIQVETIYGSARIKIADRGANNYTIQPEYEDCAQLARQHQIPLSLVQKLVHEAGDRMLKLRLENHPGKAVNTP
jgi:pyridinium-3,5-bisthiocarboxylic acid mononucleotide nickel chelatase